MEKYFIREKIIKSIRHFFYSKDFHEVIPPLLNTALPLEPNLQPFSTVHNGTNETFYLSMSPERGIKKMLARGIGNCFAISKSFRNYERIGTLHNNEFIMLEWYRKDSTYLKIMEELELLLRNINTEMDKQISIPESSFPRISLNDLFREKCGTSLEELLTDEKKIYNIAKTKGYRIDGATWEELYDQLFVNEIETSFSNEPFFLIDFPERISPLCAKKQDMNGFAERFELYINKIEIANGNTEKTDKEYIHATFIKEQEKTGLPIDDEFLTSLDQMKGHMYAGVGLGIDRLTMLYTDTDIFV